MEKNNEKRDATVSASDAELFLRDNDLKTYREGVNFLLQKLGTGDAQ